jgi:hypothetical protein
MPVNLTYSQPGEWPAHLTQIGAEPHSVRWAEVHASDKRRSQAGAVRKKPAGMPLDPRPWRIRRREYLQNAQREAQLIVEAEREAARSVK